jgi:transposase
MKGRSEGGRITCPRPEVTDLMRANVNTRDPAIREIIIKQYNKYGAEWIEKEYGVSRKDVANWKKLKADTGSLKPRMSETGRPQVLSEREEKRMTKALVKNPFATNAELAAVVKNKISPREAGRYIEKSDLDFKWLGEEFDVEASFTQEAADQGATFMKQIKRVPEAKRIYVDETFASAGLRKERGRFPLGKKPTTPQNRKYPRMVIIGAIRKNGFVRPSTIYNKGSITTDDFENYVKKKLCPYIGENDVVLWDRYGRSGRAKNPTAHHFSPRARAAIEARGAKLMMLPPTGKYFDPIEMIFGDVKKIYQKKLRKKLESRKPSKIPFETKVKLWRAAEGELNPKSFTRAFKERANGQEFSKVYKKRGLL